MWRKFHSKYECPTLWPGGSASHYFCFFGGLISSPFFVSPWNFVIALFAWWVPLYHHYFSFPSFHLFSVGDLLCVAVSSKFQGSCCRSYNCSLRSVIDFLWLSLGWPSMANIFTPTPDFCFMSCHDGLTNYHCWFTSPLAHESPKPTPLYVYITYLSVFYFYADIIPNPYLPLRLSWMGYVHCTPNVGVMWPLSCVAPLWIRVVCKTQLRFKIM